jgi:hypothetical protein
MQRGQNNLKLRGANTPHHILPGIEAWTSERV